ncbi:hypothetical protein, partial [Staphylococcus aureus]|uniref:hypothetical protein n=1 Tax=Staphylococcus aureus TaxID=1280 RepID=UPI0038B32C17
PELDDFGLCRRWSDGASGLVLMTAHVSLACRMRFLLVIAVIFLKGLMLMSGYASLRAGCGVYC